MVCQEFIIDPVKLMCKHRVCKTCLKDIYKKAKEDFYEKATADTNLNDASLIEFKCPMCQ